MLRMIQIPASLLVSLFLIFPALAAPKATSKIDKLPELTQKLKNIDGKMLTLDEIKTEKGLLVVFSCNHCPYVKKWQDRMVDASNDAVSKGIGVVFINSNDPNQNSEDSFKNMQDLAKTKGYQFPYTVDSTSDYARKFGAEKTPEVFLFNPQGQLVYHGAIDDSLDPKKVKTSYLKEAVNQLLSGQKIENAATKSLGCSIKLREKKG